MTSFPLRWKPEQLAEAAAISAAQFRAERLAVSDSWTTHYNQARNKFELLFEKLNNLNPGAIRDEDLAQTYGLGLGEASQVVPTAVLSGVFKVLNLQQAQERGLSLFWSHALDKLGTFIESTR